MTIKKIISNGQIGSEQTAHFDYIKCPFCPNNNIKSKSGMGKIAGYPQIEGY